ncbi:hypothetical protein EXIGLDRAFT_320626 [Exidia glandulosa HHB12029]|uniref:F-box domain-containing protein n=1 Tax=Exidia glandulosa HHB12029 TaxID=1314781 RepID=A0A165Q5Q8_EXIGL|nr:hypothetical protein EXIGLDRAFT_320626 [Exidia glandulosa HHB12029]
MQDAVSTEIGSETSSAMCYANLPVETWCDVWKLLPSIKDIFSASQVCVGWRSISLANRQLWSRPNVHFPPGYDQFRHRREERPTLIAAEYVAARPMLRMLDICLDRAGARIEISIQVDHAECHIEMVTRLQAIISGVSKRASAAFSRSVGSVWADCPRPMISPTQ